MKTSKAVIDSMVRAQVIEALGLEHNPSLERMSNQSFSGVTTIQIDGQDVQRAYEVRVIATAPIENISANEQHRARVDGYAEAIAEKARAAAEKAEAKVAKIARDKAKREQKKKEKEGV